MKILFNHGLPFALAHGGLQIQIERTKSALESLGVEVEYLRWWDAGQKGDIIHFFGRADPSHIDFAHGKGMKYVMLELLTGQGSRSKFQLKLQGIVERILRKTVPPMLLANFRWDAYHKADACLVGTEWEAEVVRLLFAPPEDRLHIITNGVDEVFFSSTDDPPRGDELICTVTITERKRVLETVEAAILAQTPLRIIGQPYSPDDPYFQRFLQIVHNNPQWIRYEGPLSAPEDFARACKSARGFVLLSTMESLSIAALAAAASACPLLLSDLPWAHSSFGKHATYCPIASKESTAVALRHFYDNAPKLPRPQPPPTWGDIAQELLKIYTSINTSI